MISIEDEGFRDNLERFIVRSRSIFNGFGEDWKDSEPRSLKEKLSTKIRDEWLEYRTIPRVVAAASGGDGALSKASSEDGGSKGSKAVQGLIDHILSEHDQALRRSGGKNLVVAPRGDLALVNTQKDRQSDLVNMLPSTNTLRKAGAIEEEFSSLLKFKRPRKVPKPVWHPPWKLMRVISGHVGWVRSVAVEPNNEWFATGAGDRMIKIWDLASANLKLTLTGHISSVRGLVVSKRHPYLFSCGEDKQIKCWDLEVNKVVRHYHGHLSGVYALDIHPALDVIVSGGRDSTARVWDMRTKTQIYALTGHTSTVSCVKCQEINPQIISSSMDATIRLWDLTAGKTMSVLTHHKKSVRSIALSPRELTFVSASPDNIKQWKSTNGEFLQNFENHNSIINTLSTNHDGVLFSGGDNGSLRFWDYKTGYNFQTAESIVQPGSLESENGIFCSAFDQSGARLITGEADKSIKIWREDPEATPETHPIKWIPKSSRMRY